MGTVNRVMIMGNLGVDPELRQTPSGQVVTTLSVATARAYTDRDGIEQQATEWHRVVVWGKQAELCAQYLRKGRGVFVEGRLTTRSWDDRNGEKRYATEIVASSVQFLGGAHGSEGSERHLDADVTSGQRDESTAEGASKPAGGGAEGHGVEAPAGGQPGTEAIGVPVVTPPTPPQRRNMPKVPLGRLAGRPGERARPKLEDIPF